MADIIPSPNMNMPIPVVGVDPGEDWATNVNASLSIIDSHNHSPGQGVPVTPDGIFVNADLPMNNNNLISAKSVRFYPQSAALSSPSDLGCLFEVGVDLYYIDGSGNLIRITQSGSVTGSTGTITGLPSGTASASFAAGTFTFQSATNTPAAMALGPVKIAQAVASGKGVTLIAANAQVSDYNLTFPAVAPTNNQVLTSDNSGNLFWCLLGDVVNNAGSDNFPLNNVFGGDYSINLYAGVWSISWNITGSFQGAATTQMSAFVGLVPGNNTTGRVFGTNAAQQAGPTSTNLSSMGINSYIVSPVTTTTYYLKVLAAYGSGSTPTINYNITATLLRKSA